MTEPVHVPAKLQARLLGAASPELELTFRPMFGGIMGYARGRPFAVLSKMGLAFKLAGDDHAALLAFPGAALLRFGPDKPPIRSYVVVPDGVLRDAAQLAAWSARAAAGAAAAPAKPRRKRAS